MTHRNTTKMIRIFLVLLPVLMDTGALAQLQRYEFLRGTTIRFGFHHKSWNFDNTDSLSNYTQFTLPLFIHYQLDDRMSLELVGSLYKSALATFSNNSFTNISDIATRASYMLGDNAAIFTVALGIPTGKSQLNQNEEIHAGLAANRPLEYPVTLFGSGWNFSTSLAFVKELSTWILGGGLGFTYRDKYRINASTSDINPGNEFNMTLGVDRNVKMGVYQAKFTTDVVYTNYTEDRLDNVPFYQAGDKLLVDASVLIPYGPFDPVLLFLQNRYRLDNKLTHATLIDNGNEFQMGTILYHPVKENLKMKYLFATKLYSNTVAGANGANLVEVGLGAIIKIAANRTIDPTVKLLFGTINAGRRGTINLVGVAVSGAITINY